MWVDESGTKSSYTTNVRSIILRHLFSRYARMKRILQYKINTTVEPIAATASVFPSHQVETYFENAQQVLKLTFHQLSTGSIDNQTKRLYPHEIYDSTISNLVVGPLKAALAEFDSDSNSNFAYFLDDVKTYAAYAQRKQEKGKSITKELHQIPTHFVKIRMPYLLPKINLKMEGIYWESLDERIRELAKMQLDAHKRIMNGINGIVNTLQRKLSTDPKVNCYEIENGCIVDNVRQMLNIKYATAVEKDIDNFKRVKGSTDFVQLSIEKP